MNWYVVITPPQKERKAQEALESIGHTTRMPTYKKHVRRSGGRAVKLRRSVQTRTLLERYVFVQFDGNGVEIRKEIISYDYAGQPIFQPIYAPGDDLSALRECGLVQCLMRTANQEPVRLKPEELDHLISIADNGRALDADPNIIRVGTRVEIKDGPFRNFSAVIEAVQGMAARCDMSIFGRATKVWLPFEILEVV